MNNPKISVITVCYNAAKTLEKTIQSVINQTYNNIEYIIIDGSSTDGTLDIIKKYEGRISYWKSEPDEGIYDAMNKGIKAATGEWINFMNAGDGFHSNDVLENFIPQIDDDTVIAYGDTMKMYSWGQMLETPVSLSFINQRMVFGHQSTFVKASYHKLNLFDTSFKSSGDYNFFYNAYNKKVVFQYISVTIADYDAEYGMSSTNLLHVMLEDAKIRGEISSYNKMIIYCKNAFIQVKAFIKFLFPNSYKKFKRRQNTNEK